MVRKYSVKINQTSHFDSQKEARDFILALVELKIIFLEVHEKEVEEEIAPIVRKKLLEKAEIKPKKKRRNKAEMNEVRKTDEVVVKKKVGDGRKKYPEGMGDLILENMETTLNQDLCDMINEKWDVDINKDRLKDYMKNHNLKREKRIMAPKKESGERKTRLKKYTDEVLKFLIDNINNFSNKELCEELSSRFNVNVSPKTLQMTMHNKGIKRDFDSHLTPEITEFIEKTKIKDVLLLRDEIIEKFEVNVSMAELKRIIKFKNNNLPGENVKEETKRIKQKRDPLDDDIDDLDLDGD